MSEDRCIFCASKKIEYKQGNFAPFITARMFNNKAPKTYCTICRDCNIKYSSYRPTDDEMKKLYSGYRGEDYVKQRQQFESNYTKEFNDSLSNNTERKERVGQMLKKYIDTSKINSVLDYGGDMGQYIPDCFCNAKKYVYEVSDVPVLEGVENISDKNGKYDFVMCCHVLEHVSYPREILKDLYNLCNDNGYIYIELPAENIWDGNSIHEHINNFKLSTLAYASKVIPVTIVDIYDYCGYCAIFKKEKINNIRRYFNRLHFANKPKNDKIIYYKKILDKIFKFKKICR